MTSSFIIGGIFSVLLFLSEPLSLDIAKLNYRADEATVIKFLFLFYSYLLKLSINLSASYVR